MYVLMLHVFANCFQREFYSLAELQKIPPPQGVDPAKLEAYLSDTNFQVRLAIKYADKWSASFEWVSHRILPLQK